MLFILIALVFKVFGKGLTKLIKFISLGALNRLTGGIFSAVKYIIVFTTIAIIYKNFVQIYPELLSNDYVESSNSYQLMIRLGESIIKNFNANFECSNAFEKHLFLNRVAWVYGFRTIK